MKSLRIGSSILAVVFLMLMFSSLAHAQATRTWVSGVGDDVNPCSRTAPCKTFAGAISKTAIGGKINCLDPGGFGAVTITKSIEIDCGTLTGGILASGSNGMIINANAANDVVVIRGLEIFGILPPGASQGTNGIRYLAAKRVHLENINIHGFSGICIDQASTAASTLTMTNVTMTDCPTGLGVTTTVGFAIATVNNARIWSTTNGVNGKGNSIVTVRNSDLSDNTNAVNESIAGAQINLVNNQFSNNNTAVQAIGGTTIRIVGNTFAQNTTALTGGNISSDGQNVFAGNGVNGVPNQPALLKQ